ncbi:MAG: penicillin-binding protein 1A [Elioraea sp.]|nr:penicillin-binding protein 1A [Elioraea sp.]
MRADEPLAGLPRARPAQAQPAPSPDPEPSPPATERPRRRRRRSLLGRLFGLLVGLATLATAAAGGVAVWAWHHYGVDLPDYAVLKDYEPPVMSRVYAGDSRLLAELATERRIFVPIDSIPKLVRDAFISAEDQNFWTHPGIDPGAILRAAITNLQQMGQGRRPIGASTITQQVAKNMLLGNEVTLERKIREAILAFRIERALSKERILELYLNEIFLGQGAYGVGAAAMTYFGKALDELTPAEAAYLAALPKAPNNYNPWRFPEAAKGRRDWVLDRMVADGVLDAATAEAAKATPIQVRPGRFADRVPAEYFAEEVRRQLIARFGETATTQGGLTVRTSLDPRLQEIADRALREGLMAYDRRRGGWRGPIARIDLPADRLATAWVERLAAMPRPPGTLPAWRMAVVLEVGREQARVGWLERPERPNLPPMPRTMALPLAEMAWARRALPNGGLGPAPRAASDVVSVGDIILVEPLPAEPAQAAARNRPARPALPERASLRQAPEVEGALVALDPTTGRVLALSGGWSFDRSWFNRATQALRQPGSAFKPFVYITAFEAGLPPTQKVLDAPFVIDLGPGQGRWRPTNYNEGEFGGPTPLRVGMEKSKNLMTIRLAAQMGLDRVADATRRFGVIDNLERTYAMALGAGETTVLRMAAGYAAFANGGKRVEPSLIDSVQDRNGKVIYRADRRPCERCREPSPGLLPPDLPDMREQATDPISAFQMVSILQGVVTRGTGTRANIGRPVAGKTGTTNDWLDAWFVGFTPDLVVAVWVGFDEPRPLGGARDNETGGNVAAPIFGAFMREALEGRPVVPFRAPDGVRMVWVNPNTGEAAPANAPGALLEAFRPGTEPGAEGAPAGVIGAAAGGGRGAAGAAALDAALGGLY